MPGPLRSLKILSDISQIEIQRERERERKEGGDEEEGEIYGEERDRL